MKWFRFYSEFRADPKLRRMPIPHRYAFVVLLCLAGDGSTRGVISGLDDDDIAYELEMPTEDWLTLKAKFKAKGLIHWEGESVFITNWDKRQFESDSSAERVAKHRARKKEEASNTTVTLQKRHVTPSEQIQTQIQISDPEEKKECCAVPGVEKFAVGDLGIEAETPNGEKAFFQGALIGEAEPVASQKKSRPGPRTSENFSKKEKELAFIDAYNRLKPAIWPKVTSMSGADRGKWLAVFEKQYGESPSEIAEALGVIFRGVALNNWARMRDLKVSYLFRESRYQDFYDVGLTLAEVPQYEEAMAMTDDPERLAMKIKFANYLKRDEEQERQEQRIGNGWQA